MDGGIIPKQSIIEQKGLGEQVLKLRFDGCSEQEISNQLGINKNGVHLFLSKHKNIQSIANQIPDIPTKPKIIYEINRTIAESHLSQQLAEFEKNYYNAINKDDQRTAYAWSQRWGEALDKILKVTGAYQSPPVKVEPINIVVTWKPPVKPSH